MEDFLKLIKESYDDDIDDVDCFSGNNKTTPSEMCEFINSDNFTLNQIKNHLPTVKQIDIKNFSIIITNKYKENNNMYYDFRLYDIIRETIPGKPCKLLFKIDVLSDKRFEGLDSKKYFTSFSSLSQIPVPIGCNNSIQLAIKIDEKSLLDTIRYLRVLNKLICFL